MTDAIESTKEYRHSLFPKGWEYAYAYVFFVAVFLGQTIRFFVGSDPLIGAQPAQILIPLIAILISAGLWVASPIPIRLPSGLLALFFGLLIFIWLWALIRDWGATDLTAVTLGPFLAMLATKTPTPACALRILNTMGALVLALFAFAAILAVLTDAPPTGFTTKWPPLTDPFAPIGMWWAPFNGPAESGLIGAAVVMMGLSPVNTRTFLFVPGGLLIIFYSGTLSAAIGLGVAFITFFVFWSLRSRHRRPLLFGLLTISTGLMALLISELIRNPTLSNRTRIWSDFWLMAQDAPWIGWGTANLIAWEEAMSGPNGMVRLQHGSDAHNQLLDAWVRYGAIAMVLVAATLLLAVVITFQGWRLGKPLGLSLVLMVIVVGLVEYPVWWIAPGTTWSLFVLSVVVGSMQEKRGLDPDSAEYADSDAPKGTDFETGSLGRFVDPNFFISKTPRLSRFCIPGMNHP